MQIARNNFPAEIPRGSFSHPSSLAACIFSPFARLLPLHDYPIIVRDERGKKKVHRHRRDFASAIHEFRQDRKSRADAIKWRGNCIAHSFQQFRNGVCEVIDFK